MARTKNQELPQGLAAFVEKLQGVLANLETSTSPEQNLKKELLNYQALDKKQRIEQAPKLLAQMQKLNTLFSQQSDIPDKMRQALQDTLRNLQERYLPARKAFEALQRLQALRKELAAPRIRQA